MSFIASVGLWINVVKKKGIFMRAVQKNIPAAHRVGFLR
jgi:hypothetical protein